MRSRGAPLPCILQVLALQSILSVAIARPQNGENGNDDDDNCAGWWRWLCSGPLDKSSPYLDNPTTYGYPTSNPNPKGDPRGNPRGDPREWPLSELPGDLQKGQPLPPLAPPWSISTNSPPPNAMPWTRPDLQGPTGALNPLLAPSGTSWSMAPSSVTTSAPLPPKDPFGLPPGFTVPVPVPPAEVPKSPIPPMAAPSVQPPMATQTPPSIPFIVPPGDGKPPRPWEPQQGPQASNGNAWTTLATDVPANAGPPVSTSPQTPVATPMLTPAAAPIAPPPRPAGNAPAPPAIPPPSVSPSVIPPRPVPPPAMPPPAIPLIIPPKPPAPASPIPENAPTVLSTNDFIFEADPSFYQIVNPEMNATIAARRLRENPGGAPITQDSFAHDGGVWVPERGEIWFTSDINRQPSSLYVLELKTNTVRQPLLSHNISNPVGGYYYDGITYWTAYGDATKPGALYAVDPKTGNVDKLVDKFENKRLNGPKDLLVFSKGNSMSHTIYFTDTHYGTALGLNKPAAAGVKPGGEQQDMGKSPIGVYKFDIDTKTLRLAISDRDVPHPNSVCMSRDQTRLYVSSGPTVENLAAGSTTSKNSTRSSDTRGNTAAGPATPKGSIHQFLLSASGDVLPSGKTLFATSLSGTPQGLKCDDLGNVWSAEGEGVVVRNAFGKVIGGFKSSPSSFSTGPTTANKPGNANPTGPGQSAPRTNQDSGPPRFSPAQPPPDSNSAPPPPPSADAKATSPQTNTSAAPPDGGGERVSPRPSTSNSTRANLRRRLLQSPHPERPSTAPSDFPPPKDISPITPTSSGLKAGLPESSGDLANFALAGDELVVLALAQIWRVRLANPVMGRVRFEPHGPGRGGKTVS